MREIKIGLALGSGAARGLAHIGVIRALEENGISIDVISGTSIGAVVGGLYAAGLTVKEISEFALEFGKKRVAYWIDPSFFRGGGLIKGDKIEQALKELTGPIDFKGLKIPFYAVASDLVTFDAVVLAEGQLSRAVRASFAIPGIFSPVRYDGHWLIDGALVAPVPTRVLRENGCDLIIAVNVSTAPEKEESISPQDIPGILDVLMQTIYMAQQKIAEPCMRLADINIVPAVGEYGWTDFSRAADLIEAGYEAAIKVMPGIKRTISRRRRFLFLKRLF